MPNWCYNYASFSGERTKELADLLKEGADYNQEFHQGWAPKFIPDPDRYLFDISNIELTPDGNLRVRFETKWAPSLTDFDQICNHFNLSGELEYEELAMGIYGKYTYDPELGGKDVYLDGAEIDSIEYNEETDMYYYNGQESESQYEFLSDILDAKIRQS